MQLSLTEHTENNQSYSELIQQIGIYMFRIFL